jgi:hypothetical protein
MPLRQYGHYTITPVQPLHHYAITPLHHYASTSITPVRQYVHYTSMPVGPLRHSPHSLASVKDMYVEMGFPLNLYQHFSSEEYRLECFEKKQSQSFLGVGVQHQNSKAERVIQTIMYMACTFLVHSSLHWTDMGADDISFWPFAVNHKHANFESGLTPMELLTKQKADHCNILRSHVWGCPLYVLEPKLQIGQKLSKWNRWSRLGQFLGYSDEHSSLVANIRHLKTSCVSPQYHVVFDDLLFRLRTRQTTTNTQNNARFYW